LIEFASKGVNLRDSEHAHASPYFSSARASAESEVYLAPPEGDERAPDYPQRNAHCLWIGLFAPVFPIRNYDQCRKPPNSNNFIPNERIHPNFSFVL
jgi:hypothetical protein